MDPTGRFSVKDFAKGAVSVVLEPFRQVADVVVAGIATHAMGIDAEDVRLSSMLGRSQQQRVVEGQGGVKTAAKGIGETVFAVGTVGIGPAIVSHVELARAYDRGELTIDEYDAALSEMAGGQAAGAVIAKVAGGRSSARVGAEIQVQPKGAGAVRIIEGNRGARALPEGPVIEMVRSPDGTFVPAFETRSAGLGHVRPAGGLPSAEPGGFLRTPSSVRLPQDVSVRTTAPRPLPLTRRIGSSPGQHAALQADIAAAKAQGARNIRVNQQQLDAAGNRVGIGRPDLQYTRPDGTHVHIEYDTPSSGRGLPHAKRLLSNDPEAVVETKTIK